MWNCARCYGEDQRGMLWYLFVLCTNYWGNQCDVLLRNHLDHKCLIPEHHTTSSMRKCKESHGKQGSEKASGIVGFFIGNRWVPDWEAQAGWSNCGRVWLSIQEVETANGWPEGRFTHTNVSLTSKVVYKYLCPYFQTGRCRLPFLIKNRMIWHYWAHSPGWKQSCRGSSSCSLRCHPAVPVQ